MHYEVVDDVVVESTAVSATTVGAASRIATWRG